MSVDKAFLQKLESLFPGQASGPWYVYAGLIFQANDHMDKIKTLWEYLADSTPKEEDQFVKARKLRESLLKASVLVGFPKVCDPLRQAKGDVLTCYQGNQRMHSSTKRNPSKVTASGREIGLGHFPTQASPTSRKGCTRQRILRQDLRSTY